MKNYDAEDKEQHFFAACPLGWATDENMFTAIDKLKRAFYREFPKGKMFVLVVHVPLPHDAKYGIHLYTPQVPDCTMVFQGYIQ